MITVNDMWEEYACKVMPANPHPIQYSETKRAYYAACFKMLISTRDIAGHKDISEAEAVHILESWKKNASDIKIWLLQD